MMTEFLMPKFWESAESHVASPPGEDTPGLREFVRLELGERGWCFFSTSGTEGARKWAGLTKEALLTSARAVNAHYDITERDHWLLALPTHHVGGFGVLARSFASGSNVTQLEGKWDARAFVQCCEKVGATLVSLVPTQVFDLVAATLAAPKALRVVLVGGGAMSPEVEQAALQLGWPLRRTFGMTETASQIASQREAHGEMEVLPIWSLQTEDESVLRVRGAALAAGYALYADGAWRWQAIPVTEGLRTRDRVSLRHADGRTFLRFLGREAGVVKILGELVALAPVQQCIDDLKLSLSLAHGDAAVCDLPDERQENKLILAVSGLTPTQATLLQTRHNAAVPPLQQLSETRIVAAIPRSDLGKIRLHELRGLL